MPVIRKSALVPYPAEAMFDLVERVEDYPDFLPWCGGTQLLSRTDTGMSAAITINFKGLRQTFSTENVHQRPTSIQLRLKDGPFPACRVAGRSNRWLRTPAASISNWTTRWAAA